MSIQLPIRMAVRELDGLIRAYIVVGGEPVEDGLMVGAISAAACAEDPDLFETFKQLMKTLLMTFMQSSLGADQANKIKFLEVDPETGQPLLPPGMKRPD